MKSEFDFDLAQPITYKPDNSGEQEECRKLILKAPTNKQRTQRTKLKQFVYQAILYIQQNPLKAEENEVDVPDEVKNPFDSEGKSEEELQESGKNFCQLMYMCPTIDMTVVNEEFLILLLEVCLVEGEKKLTKPLYDKMSPVDTDNLLGAYLANFIIGS